MLLFFPLLSPPPPAPLLSDELIIFRLKAAKSESTHGHRNRIHTHAHTHTHTHTHTQVYLGATGSDLEVTYTFTSENWAEFQGVSVRPIPDDGLDGQDYRVFAAQPSRAQLIQGIVYILALCVCACELVGDPPPLVCPSRALAISRPTARAPYSTPIIPILFNPNKQTGPLEASGNMVGPFNNALPDPVKMPREKDGELHLYGNIPSKDIDESLQIDVLHVENLDGKIDNPAFGGVVSSTGITGLNMGVCGTLLSLFLALFPFRIRIARADMHTYTHTHT